MCGGLVYVASDPRAATTKVIATSTRQTEQSGACIIHCRYPAYGRSWAVGDRAVAIIEVGAFYQPCRFKRLLRTFRHGCFGTQRLISAK